MKRRVSLAIAVALLSGMGLASSPVWSSRAWAQDASKGEVVFKCRACHAIGPAATNKAGPALTGIVGRKGASVPGFNYSEAMKKAAASGLEVDAADLAQYLRSPDTFLAARRHGLRRREEPGELQDLIAFLKLHK
jgi:cytochrome c